MFISFEGGDGSGKTTHIHMLAARLEKEGYDICTTREPGGTPLGQKIRALLLHGGHVSARAEALLYAADRAHHIDTVVRPALEKGIVVLADRYLDSSVAYQGVARQLGKDEVRALSLWATQNLLPDLTILLDVSTEVGTARVGNETDRIESAGKEFHEAVRREYLHLAHKEPERFVIIDANRRLEDVAEDIYSVVLTRLKQNTPQKTEEK